MKYCLAVLFALYSMRPCGAVDAACEPALALYRTYLAASDADWHPTTATEFRTKLNAFATPACLDATWREKTEARYDPIVQAQDWSPDWKKYLSATLVRQTATQRTCRVTIDPTWPQIVTVHLEKIGARWLVTNFLR